jgi:hypothetical protein
VTAGPFMVRREPPLVLVESPYAGDVERNLRYARACMRDAFMRGYYPFASHLLYTQLGILDDTIEAERELGIKAGLAWGRHATRSLIYTDLGTSRGMREGVANAAAFNRAIDWHTLPGWTP